MNDTAIEGPRGCTKTDLEPMLAMINSIFRPDGSQDLLTDYPLVYRDENLSNVRLIRAGRNVLSVVPFIPWTVEHEGCRFKIGVISPTASHPEHRHKGYGLRCLESCIECMGQQGIDLSVLWTLVPTFSFYNHGGYQGVPDQGHTYPCARGDAALFAHACGQVVAYDPDSRRYLKRIMKIHESAPFGFVRSQDQTATLLGLPKLSTFLTLKDEEPTAYLCMSRSTNKPGIIEAGGDAVGIETLMHHALRTLNDNEPVLVHISLSRTPLYDVIQEKVSERRQGSGENTMIRINDASSFLRKIAPWLERRNGDADTSFSIDITDAGETVCLDFAHGELTIGSQRRAQHLEMTRLDLTSAIFGPHPARPFETPAPLDRLFPFYFSIGVIDRS